MHEGVSLRKTVAVLSMSSNSNVVVLTVETEVKMSVCCAGRRSARGVVAQCLAPPDVTTGHGRFKIKQLGCWLPW